MTDFHDELFTSTVNGDLESLRIILALGADPRHNNSLPISLAAENGHAECVKLLIPLSDPKSRDSLALVLAATSGHAECVRLLIPVSDPEANSSNALRWAAVNGHAECVKLLIPASGPLLQNKTVLAAAMTCGNAETLSHMLASEPLLLDGQDLFAHQDAAIANGHAELALLLCSHIEQQALSGLLSASTSNDNSMSRNRL